MLTFIYNLSNILCNLLITDMQFMWNSTPLFMLLKWERKLFINIDTFSLALYRWILMEYWYEYILIVNFKKMVIFTEIVWSNLQNNIMVNLLTLLVIFFLLLISKTKAICNETERIRLLIKPPNVQQLDAHRSFH